MGRMGLICPMRPWSPQLVREFLGEHSPTEITANSADAYLPELRSQDVCSVAGTVHQSLVSNLHGRSVSQVFTGRQEADASFAHAIKRAARVRRDVRKIILFKHLLAVSACNGP